MLSADGEKQLYNNNFHFQLLGNKHMQCYYEIETNDISHYHADKEDRLLLMNGKSPGSVITKFPWC